MTERASKALEQELSRKTIEAMNGDEQAAKNPFSKENQKYAKFYLTKQETDIENETDKNGGDIKYEYRKKVRR